MKDHAESRLLNEQHNSRRKPENMRMPISVWPTTAATIIALIACLAFSIFFQRGLSGFSKQVNAFISLGDFSSILLQSIVFIISAVVIIYLLVVYLASVYFLFIGGIYSFCALVDQQCFDFRVLIPAIVSRFSNKKVDMIFCAEKKELLCSQNNNQIWNFLLSFIFALVTLAALIFLQNCVVYGLGKRQASKEQRSRERHEGKEKYEMKQLS